jgi:hypothetical protein
MRLFCTLGWHSPGPQILWNAGFWFTKCRDCERDLVRSRHRGWHVPVGAKVVWQAKAPVPRPPAEPEALVASAAPDIIVEAGKPPKRVKRAKGAVPIAPADIAVASEPAALIEPAEAAAPVEFAAPAHGSAPSRPLAPAERLDLAQFVAEMLHSAGPAVPVQHAVLDDEPGRREDGAEESEPSQASAIEMDASTEALLTPEAVLHETGEAAEELAETLVADAPPPLEHDEPFELVVGGDPDPLEPDQREGPHGQALAVEHDGDAVTEPVEAQVAETAPSHADAPLDFADPAAADAEVPAAPAEAEPEAAPASAAEADPWADFLDDDDDDDDDFAWAQESPPQSPAARAAAERPAAPRSAPERPAGGGQLPGAERLNEPFRSDLDGRKRASRNSVKR